MSKLLQTGCLARLRLAALGAAALLLAGCATGYTFVQPDAAGGGYYTGTGAYPSSGYYYNDDYGADAWFPGYAGFGYDPYFYIPELGKTVAELAPDQKNKLSHRGRALRVLLDALTSNAPARP